MESGFTLASNSFRDGEVMPDIFTRTDRGQNISPALYWTGVPDGTKSFTLLLEDPNLPFRFFTITHWLMYNIPSDMRELPQDLDKKADLPNGIIQGVNWQNQTGYTGPSPIRGKRTYIFKLYALDTLINPRPRMKRLALLKEINEHILAQTSLTLYCSK